MGINRPVKINISVKEFAEGIALKEFIHPFILIDKNGEIHYSLGKCDKYFGFHVGEPDQNIVNLSREGLKIPLSNALRQFNRDSKPVYCKNIKVKVRDGIEVINFALTPVTKPSFNHLVIVNIEPVRTTHILSEINKEDENDISESQEEYIRQIEMELKDTRDHLKNVNEELETANKELKSLNKEEKEEELVIARDATEQAASLKSMFLANMSHEIRTPLNSILGFADMLRREVSDDKPVRYLENINNSSRQLLYLINDIVDVSRLDAGELPVHCSSTGLGELMNLVKDQFEGYASKNKNINIDFRLKLPEDKEDLFVITDENRLQQILRNLLSNAFKYTDEGYIEFGYEVRKSNLLFYVSDTGVGISRENHEKVFDRFQQAGNGRNNKRKVIRGTGLGLAIARGLTERLGGKMWLSSEEGKGSVFYFTIPYKKGEATKSNASHVREEAVLIPQFKGKKIIIAEDDPYSLEMLKIMLQDTKITMFVARDGDEVMDIFKNQPVDILLLDIRMPKKDGYELAREIRSSYPGIPIIAQSAFAMPEQIHKSLEMGFNKHLVKPLKREDLYHALETFLK